jgi:hypothetical protein
VPPDTTPVEQRVPAIMDLDLLPDYAQNDLMNVLNRKNALFAGHDLGAENWAVVASLIETCNSTGSCRDGRTAGWPSSRHGRWRSRACTVQWRLE